MGHVNRTTVPAGSLIATYAERAGHHTDAFWAKARPGVTLSELITLFYTTPLFRAERLVLHVFAGRKSTDIDVRAIATGTANTFAVWQTEARTETEILLADTSGRTKSWFWADEGRVWFGSVVTPVERNGVLTLGFGVNALMVAHVLYSRLLLGSAVRSLR